MKLRVLIAEDDPAHAVAIRRGLGQGEGAFEIRVAGTLEEFRRLAAADPPDIALLDLNLPDGRGVEVLTFPPEAGPFPVLILTSYGNDQAAVDAIKGGALDYLVKSPETFSGMGQTVERALREWRLLQEKKESEEALRQSRHLYQKFLDSTPDMAFLKDEMFRHLIANQRLLQFVGKPIEEVIGKSDFDLMPADAAESCRRSDKAALAVDAVTVSEETAGERIFESIKFPVQLSSSRRGIGGYIHEITEQRRAEEALERNRSELQAIYDHAPVMMCLVDETRRVLYANRFFTRFTGLSLSELTAGRACGVFGCVNALEDPRGCGFGADCQKCPLRLAMEETLQTGRSKRNIEQTMVLSKAGGSQKVVLLGATALIPTKIRPSLLLCLEDITERQRAEQALLKSESKYRRLYESLMDAYVRVDMTGRIKEFNSAYKDMLGYSEEELHRLTYVDLTPERWHSLERDLVEKQILVKGYSDVYEKEYRKKDGSEFPVEMRTFLIRDSHGRPEGMWAIVRDISERKRAEEALRKAEEKYSKAFQASPDWGAITTLDEGVFFEVNKAFERLSGFARKEVLGRTSEEMGIWDQPEERHRLVDSMRKQGAVHNQEVHFRLKNGTVQTFLLSAETIELEGQALMLTVARDMTELRSLEAQFRQAQKMEAVGRLAGGVAHDFNNMLGVILGYTDLALTRLNVQEPLYQDLQEVNNAARRSADLTRQLLAFSRKQMVAPRSINLNMAVTLQHKMLRRLIGEDIELIFVPGQDLWNIYLDPSQVGQVLANLAVNARDAIAGVGTVTIETSNITLDESYTRRYPYITPGDYVQLAVSDSGCGMDGETLENIFEPFFTTKAEGQGTGLGLSTVYGIVKQNKGSIQAYSEPGRGTIFKIYFPRFLGESVPVEQERERPLGGSETVLIVEDESQILLLAKRILEHYGYKTMSAGSPGEALLLLEKYSGPLDLLLTDVIMPNMTGPELKARVEALQPGIKTVFMSGYPADVIAQRGLLDNLDKGLAFIQKPFTLADLAGQVRKALDG